MKQFLLTFLVLIFPYIYGLACQPLFDALPMMSCNLVQGYFESLMRSAISEANNSTIHSMHYLLSMLPSHILLLQFCAYLRSFQNETIFADFSSTHFCLHLRIGLLALVWSSYCVLDYDELQNHLPTLFEFVITSAKSESFIDHIGRPNIIPSCCCLFILISLPFHVTFTW